MLQQLSSEEMAPRLDLLKDEYVKLLNDKDVLLNWGVPQLEALYTTHIGTWQLQKLQTQLRIKALKLKMEMIRSCLNRNQPVDLAAIELEVAVFLADAEELIGQESQKLERAQILLSSLETPERSRELRKLYRELAKQLHPDVNNDLTPELIQLWHLVREAYQWGDLEKMKALQIAYEKELAVRIPEMSIESLTQKIESLITGIKRLQDEIRDIKNEFPFTLEHQLKDPAWIAEQTLRLKEEIKKLDNYELELTAEFEQQIEQVC